MLTYLHTWLCSVGCHKPTKKSLHASFSWKPLVNQRQINVRAIRIAFKCCKYHQLPINNHINSIRNWAQSENTLTATDKQNTIDWFPHSHNLSLFWWLDNAKWNSLLSRFFEASHMNIFRFIDNNNKKRQTSNEKIIKITLYVSDKFTWIISMLIDKYKWAKKTFHWLSEGWMLFILHITYTPVRMLCR